MYYQQQLILSDLSAVFTKNVDAGVGTLDSFIEARIQKSKATTQTRINGGRQPKWKTPLRLQFLFSSTLQFLAFDKDPDKDEQIGVATIDIKQLSGGKSSVKLIGKGMNAGQLFFKYEIRKLPSRKILQLCNIKVVLPEKREGTSRCVLGVLTEKGELRSEKVHENGLTVVWEEEVRLYLQGEEDRVRVRVYVGEELVVEEGIYDVEFRSNEGVKEYPLIDLHTLEIFGLLTFSYRALNFPIKTAQSQRNNPVFSRLQFKTFDAQFPQIPSVNFSKLMIRIFSNQNFVDSMQLDFKTHYSKWNFNKPITAYREKTTDKITIMLLDCRLAQDKLIGLRQILVSDLSQGIQTIQLKDAGSHSTTKLMFDLTLQTTPLSLLTISLIQLRLHSKYTHSRSFIKGRIGCWSVRTQTSQLTNKRSFFFHRQLSFIFSDEQILEFFVYDEDISTFQLVGVGSVRIAGLLGNGKAVQVGLENRVGEEAGVVSLEFGLRLSEMLAEEIGKESGVVLEKKNSFEVAANRSQEVIKKTSKHDSKQIKNKGFDKAE